MMSLDPAIETYLDNHADAESDALQSLRKAAHAELDDLGMLSGKLQGDVLFQLVKLARAKTVVEIGMFAGYSALRMAEALPHDGVLYTTDVEPRYIAFAKRHFETSPHGAKIKILEGPALETVPQAVSQPIDVAYIDADKTNYLNYYEMLLPKLADTGIIIADNVLWSGRVLNPEKPDDHALREFGDTVAKDSRVTKMILPVRDGLMLIQKN